MADIDFPYRFDKRGLTASADETDHIRDLIHQVLFTSPGERVMRPAFGSGLLQLVFAPHSAELAATTQMLVQSALEEWLGDRIQVNSLDVQADEAALLVKLDYTIRRTQQRLVEEFKG
jgi:phage baseplate assembly protein W